MMAYLDKFYDEGWWARGDDCSKNVCPYDEKERQAEQKAWMRGYDAADNFIRKRMVDDGAG